MYEKLNFKDKIVERPNTYEVQTNDDGTITLIPAFGKIYKQGTLINSINMDHIEEGIVFLDNNKQNKVLHGTDVPAENLGEDGDIYFQYEE